MDTEIITQEELDSILLRVLPGHPVTQARAAGECVLGAIVLMGLLQIPQTSPERATLVHKAVDSVGPTLAHAVVALVGEPKSDELFEAIRSLVEDRLAHLHTPTQTNQVPS